MKIKFNVTGTERKKLVTTVSEFTGWEPVYKGAPTFAYAVNNFIIDKNGTLTGAVTEELLTALAEQGFINPDAPESAEPQTVTDNVLSIEMPKDGFTETSLSNLKKLVESKAKLIKKVIGTDSLPIEETENSLRFPWFNLQGDEALIRAYTKFISALCNMAKKQKRVTAKEKNSDNEKFDFRVFLIRLGFVGDEYKSERKILLRNLSGNSAFKNGAPPKTGASNNE